jgi:general secretion pathway protein D
LISEQENSNRQGIPLLDQLPHVGDLFAHQNKTKVRTELIIFIRPQIIRNAVDANLVAEELRTKLHGRVVGTKSRPPPAIPFQ